MTRIASALVLLLIVVGTIWFLPPVGTLVLAEVALFVAFLEYAALAERLGARIPRGAVGVAVLATCAAVGWSPVPAIGLLMAATIVVAAMAVGTEPPGPDVLRNVSVGLFAVLYLGLPVGALVAVRAVAGREALLVLVVTIVISDSAQFYGGRLLGRRLLAPALSPKKTIEGALVGIVAGMATMVLIGGRFLPPAPAPALGLLGVVVAGLGIVGDLFESLLKRGAGVKDTSGLIPGHGGVLDRLDSWLFATPAFYLFVRYTM